MENKIPTEDNQSTARAKKNAPDFFIGFFGVFAFIFLVWRIQYYLPVDMLAVFLAPIVVVICLVYFFSRRRWIFWGMLTALVIAGSVFVYFLSQIRFGP